MCVCVYVCEIVIVRAKFCWLVDIQKYEEKKIENKKTTTLLSDVLSSYPYFSKTLDSAFNFKKIKQNFDLRNFKLNKPYVK